MKRYVLPGDRTMTVGPCGGVVNLLLCWQRLTRSSLCAAWFRWTTHPVLDASHGVAGAAICRIWEVTGKVTIWIMLPVGTGVSTLAAIA